MEKAKKASIEAVSCLARCSRISKTPIQFEKSSDACTYSDELTGPGYDHLRAIYNIWGLDRVMELIKTPGGIAQEYLSECDVSLIFEKQRHLFGENEKYSFICWNRKS